MKIKLHFSLEIELSKFVHLILKVSVYLCWWVNLYSAVATLAIQQYRSGTVYLRSATKSGWMAFSFPERRLFLSTR